MSNFCYPMFINCCVSVISAGLSATQCVMSATITIIHELLSEEGDKGPFVSNDIL